MAEPRVRGKFEAEDRTGPAVKSVQKNLKKMEASFDKIANKANRVGKNLSVRLTAPIAGFGALALRTAGEFEASMNRVEAKAKIAEVSIEKLTEQAKELGRTTQFSARQAAEAQEVLATAGFDSTQIYGALPGVLDLAAAGTIELARAADFTAITMRAFNIPSEKAATIADLLAKGNVIASQSVEDLGSALAKAGNAGAAFGLSIEDTSAALSVLANSNLRAEEGGIALTNFLANIQAPASKAKKQVEAFGLSLTGLDGRLLPVSDLLDTFNKAGIEAANAAEFFGTKTLRTFLALDKGKESLAEFNEELSNRNGKAAELAAANLEGLNGELTKLKSAFEGLQIAIADAGLLDFATQLVTGIGGLVSTISALNPELLKTATIVAGVVAAIGPAVLIFGALAGAAASLVTLPATFAALGVSIGGLGTVIASIASPVGLVVAALGTIGVAVSATDKKFREFFSETARSAVRDLRDTVAPVFEGLVGLFRNAVVPAAAVLAKVFGTNLVIALRIVAKVVKVTVGPVFEALGFFLGTVIPKVIGVVVKVFDGFANFVASAFRTVVGWIETLLQKIALVPGPLGNAAEQAADKLGKMEDSFELATETVDTAGEAVSSFSDIVDQKTGDAADAAAENNKRLNQELLKSAELAKLLAEESARGIDFSSFGPFTSEREAQEQEELVDRLLEKYTAVNAKLVESIEPIGGAALALNDQLVQLAPTIRNIGLDLADGLIGAIDLFGDRSSTIWQRFGDVAKNVINQIAQEIASKLLRAGIGALFSFLPGGGLLSAIFSKDAATGGTPSTASVVVQNNFSTLTLATTEDYVRGDIATQEAARRYSSFRV